METGDGGADPSPLILSVDAATAERSVAVVRGTEVIALVAGAEGQKSSASVLGDIDAALKAALVEVGDVDLFAVAVGPGSFTGLRAGIATIQSFASTLGRPSIGVQTLHAVAHAARPSTRMFASIPAGRGEVYAQLLAVDLDGEVSELGAPVHIKPSALLETADTLVDGVTFAGSGARLIREALPAKENQDGAGASPSARSQSLTQRGRWRFNLDSGPLAPSLAALALKAFEGGRASSAQDLKPVYVRLSDAELNEQCRA